MSVSGLFDTWSIGFAGPLREPDAGNKYLLFAVEHLSCWTVACAIGAELFSSTGVVSFLEEHICWSYGNPLRILSDGDSKFDHGAVRDFESSSVN